MTVEFNGNIFLKDHRAMMIFLFGLSMVEVRIFQIHRRVNGRFAIWKNISCLLSIIYCFSDCLFCSLVTNFRLPFYSCLYFL